MCKSTWFILHTIAFISLSFATGYIVLNETDKLDKVKRECYNKTMDIKDSIKKKLKS